MPFATILIIVALNQEQKGVFIDPLEWASKNADKLKTIRVGNTNVTPQMMIRDKKHDVIKHIRENEKKSLVVNLPYHDYVMFHRICYSKGISPTEFIQKMVAMFEVEDENLFGWLDEIDDRKKDTNDSMPLTEDELYEMLERSRKE